MAKNTINLLIAPKEIIDSIVGENGEIDFNKIIPMPENLERGARGQWRKDNWEIDRSPRETKRLNDTMIKFKTISNPPLKVMGKLAESKPEQNIIYAYAGDKLGTEYGLLKTGENSWENLLDVPQESAIALQFSTIVRTGDDYVSFKKKETASIKAELTNDDLSREDRDDLETKVMINDFDISRIHHELEIFVKSAYGRNAEVSEINFKNIGTYTNF